MTEQELRQLVRETIARVGSASIGAASPILRNPAGPASVHAAFALLNVPSGADGSSSGGVSSGGDGPCIIEPAVPCNHCGYCKSYGH
jgi:hypothetical protein